MSRIERYKTTTTGRFDASKPNHASKPAVMAATPRQVGTAQDNTVDIAVEAERTWFIKVLKERCQCQHGVCHCCTLAGVVKARMDRAKETL